MGYKSNRKGETRGDTRGLSDDTAIHFSGSRHDRQPQKSLMDSSATIHAPNTTSENSGVMGLKVAQRKGKVG